MNDQQSALLRYNRAGLRRFRYVDGNAATYMELLRQALGERFSAWTAVSIPPPPNETEAERNRRLEQQYYDERRDLAWEILRAFARASHVLTEYMDAYANEKYLGTATQASSIENLLAMLDYRPAPPASATTALILLAKENQRGTIEKGLQVQYSPPSGDTVVFETLHTVEVDAALNTLRPRDYDRNPEPVNGATLVLDALPVELRRGRPLIVQRIDGDGAVILTRVVDYHPPPSAVPGAPPDAAVLVLADPLPADYTVDNTLVYANVVTAGHGETRPERILGNGNAVLVNQRFLLDVSDIAFVPDAVVPGGVRADVEVRVEDEPWTQVSTLNDSSPTDHHYVVHLDEQQRIAIEFGDGRNGRRLPTGVNNVRIRYRQGSGPAGNVGPGSLETLVRPHPLLDTVRQPRTAGGGHGGEDIDSLRRAPVRVLTLNRAVSLADFARLAEGHSSVRQANAVALPTGFRQRDTVGVVVVPAGEAEVRDIAEPLQAFIENYADPGIRVQILPYQSVRIGVHVSVHIDTPRFPPDTVLAAVRAALIAALSIQRRRLAQPLFLGELYRVVEAIPGVAYSECQIVPPIASPSEPPPLIVTDPSGLITQVNASEPQIIHLDATDPQVTAIAEEMPA